MNSRFYLLLGVAAGTVSALLLFLAMLLGSWLFISSLMFN